VSHQPGWPHFFIIGAPRCGTTFLYGALRAQPGVFMPECKEPKFFAADLDTGTPHDGRVRVRDEASYKDLFKLARPNQLVGEASPMYLVSAVAVPRILDVRPSARFVVSLRDPVHLIASYHGLMRAEGVEQLDLESALRVEQERFSWTTPTRMPAFGGAPRYRAVARYGEQLARLFSIAPRDQILVLLLDELEAHPLATVTRVTRFLGLPDPTPFGNPNRNASRALRSRRILQAMWSPTTIACAKRVMPRGLHQTANRVAMRTRAWNHREVPRPMMSTRLATELRGELRPDLDLASELLGQDLVSRWWDTPPS
jgi:hypothetical protein